jgi:YD repeat-containing protein
VVETRTPGPRSGDDTLVITTYNDQAHTVWQSVPFEITHGSGWVDPNGVTDYQGIAPGGTVTFFDALGRPLAVQDPLFGSSQEPGIACSVKLGGSYTACTNYTLGSVSGDTNTYATLTSIDPNKHVRVSYLDALGRTVYTQQDSGRYGGGPTVNQRQNLVYNVLNERTQVKVIDKAPLTGQTITTATTTAQYDDLGRLTQVADPDRGTHSYTLDADGRVLTDVSGTRTIGSNYDLLGRLGCVQDASPTINATGACSAGNLYVQNTYDTNKLTVSGTTDYPIGRLTQSVAKTYLTGAPGGDTVTTTESYEHDARGRLQAAQLQFECANNFFSSCK